ncbi:hypothetical protein RchiOBHm_Chr2g0126251 [Rosa chinensis]|uniref:Uncharacterized protein n=1 Tax=Rosa chinensis TaxID=74649 RepID=A0A2P6RTS8_ROSCH|nr:hypothetical protein RchiOBHm_Chr2g0126251 [Rosa chinensis]
MWELTTFTLISPSVYYIKLAILTQRTQKKEKKRAKALLQARRIQQRAFITKVETPSLS